MKVLMYHRIVGNRAIAKKNWTSLHIDDFRNHLRVLEQLGYTTITFRDYYLIQNNKLNMPKKPIILTFDDGYLDNYQWAFPLLSEFGMKAVIFVLGDRSIDYNYWDEESDLELALLMNDKQVLDLHREGMEIGTHSMRHMDLTNLDSFELQAEINDSKEVIETLIKDSVYSFSYPYGRSNEQTQKAVLKAGYRFACSVFTGPASFCEKPMDIRRITISNDTKMTNFGIRILTPYEYYTWFSNKIKHGLGQAINAIVPWNSKQGYEKLRLNKSEPRPNQFNN